MNVQALLICYFTLFTVVQGDCSYPYAQWGNIAVDTLLQKFWSSNSNYLYASYSSSNPSPSLTGYWTFAQGFDAVLDLIERNSSYSKDHILLIN